MQRYIKCYRAVALSTKSMVLILRLHITKIILFINYFLNNTRVYKKFTVPTLLAKKCIFVFTITYYNYNVIDKNYLK